MRISLLYNHSSGRRVSLRSLRDTLVREGHELVRIVDSRDSSASLADPPAELVVAAGGDGTVSVAARAVAGRGVPLAVLPLGTANNIALSLGARGSIAQLARVWHTAARRSMDVGLVRGDWGSQHFIEGVGMGLVHAVISSMTERPGPRGEAVPARLSRALQRYVDVLARLEPQRRTLFVDGHPRTDDYLLIEVLNARAVGPNLAWAPAADPGDALLNVVLATEQHRAQISSWLRALRSGRPTSLALPSETARTVAFDGPYEMHVDDELVSEPTAAAATIDIEPAALTVLDTSG